MEAWVFVTVYFVSLLALGVYAGKQSKSMNDFFVAGRNLGPIVIAATWFATAISGSTFIGFGGYVWTWGWAPLGMLSAEMTIPLVQFGILAPKIRTVGEKIGALTMSDILGHRYNSETLRLTSAIVTIILCIPMMIVQYTAAGRLFEGFLGVNYVTAIVIFAGIVILYTAAGGFLAVAWTDAMQGLIMFFGVIVLAIASLKAVGGLSSLNAKLAVVDPRLLTYPGPDDYMTWKMFFSQLVLWNIGWIGNPTLTSRFLAMKGKNTAKRAMVISTLAFFIVVFLAIIPGLTARILLPDLPVADLAFPMLLKKLLNPWIAAIYATAVLGSAMSTADSILLVATSAVVR
ncbi:MAG TPA: hypothetical protein GX519_07605, partial [Thermoanaerobacterales bacterium]|nr:hypothetical protein [Thermoanaerobacterales bacterium]